MIIEFGNIESCYDRIREASRGRQNSVQLFVAADVDGVCAARILAELLRTDNITFRLSPVFYAEDLMKFCRQAISEGTVNSMILINCGSHINLHNDLELEAHPDVMLYLCDYHRPIDLVSVYGDRVMIFDDGHINEDVPSWDVLMGGEDGDGGGDGDDDSDKNASADEDDDLDDENDGDGDGEKPQDVKHRNDKNRKEKEKGNQATARYYSSSHYGMSSSNLMYEIASRYGRDRATSTMLWWRIIGVTAHLITHRIDADKFTAECTIMNSEVLRTNPTEEEIRAQTPAPDGGGGDDNALVYARRDHGRISYGDDPTIPLLRFSTLFSSLTTSSYVYSRMKLWTEKGMHRFYTMLAKMGIPLTQAQQFQQTLDPATRKQMIDKVRVFIAEFDIDQLFVAAFTQNDGYNVQVAAADVAYAVGALLQGRQGNVSPPWIRAGTPLNDNQLWFWNAWDALSMQGYQKLSYGIEAAKLDLVDLFTLVKAARASGAIKSYSTDRGHFRYALLSDEILAPKFCHPLAIQQLAWVLADTYHFDVKHDHDEVPKTPYSLVVGVPYLNSNNDTMVLCGVAGEVGKNNKLTQAFRLATGLSVRPLRITYDLLEPCIIRVHVSDVGELIEALKSGFFRL